jgi:His-Xaa-Ser system protein HxsD
MSLERFSWLHDVTEESLCVRVDTTVYPLQALFRVCYVFTDRCYLFLQPVAGSSVIEVMFTRKASGCDMPSLAGEFSNELINQKVRMDVAAETKAIRELIVAQAFAEADFLATGDSEASYLDDPKGIAR